MPQSKEKTSPSYPVVFYLISPALGLVFGWLLLEGILWMAPVGDAVLHTRIDPDYQIRLFEPNTEIKWSTGRSFTYRTKKHSNNLGFLSDNDFFKSSTTKLMIVIGDSYVAASQVSNSDTFHELLHSRLDGNGRVYGLGMSGSPLSNYLVFAEFSRKQLNPDAMAFVIVGNDFDESMCQYFNLGTGMWCFTDRGNEEFDLVPISPPESQLRKIARYSALMRYIVFNLGVSWRDLFKKLSEQQVEEREFAGNVAASVSPERLEASRLSVDLFFESLPEKSGLPAEQILFVVDANRQDIYSERNDGASSFFGKMRKYFIDIAEKSGYEVIDMEPVFADDFGRLGEKFEYPTDGHWNALAQHLVASEIGQSKVFVRNFGEKISVGDRPQGIVY